MSLFIPITKVDVARRLVYGTLSEEIPDKSGEILDYVSAKPAFMEWSEQSRRASGGKSLGNVRAMHSNIAAGKLTDISFNDEAKRIEGVAKIVDDDEWKKVLEGVYTGFSIGGGYARRWPDMQRPDLMRYTPTLSEVSLADNPAVPTATFEVVKQDGSVELRKFSLQRSASAQEDDAMHVARLLKELAWLENILKQDSDDEMLDCVHSLQDYLSDDDHEMEESGNNDDDDTSAHAYAGELIHLARRARPLGCKTENIDFTELCGTVDALKKRIAELEAQPMQAKGILRAISKTDDRANEPVAIVKKTASETVHELMKIALANPVIM